jgi:DNA-binding MarR family transcriptional regulator
VLSARSGTNLAAFAAALGLSVSATSRLSDRLVVAGWVCREVSSHTRREIVLNLTDVGRNLLGASDRHRIATLTGALEQLPAARRATIVTALCDFAEAARPGGTGRARS